MLDNGFSLMLRENIMTEWKKNMHGADATTGRFWWWQVIENLPA